MIQWRPRERAHAAAHFATTRATVWIALVHDPEQGAR